MLARNEVIFKWALYGAAALLCVLAQGLICQRVTIFWGVVPFLYPLLAAIPATYESPRPGTVFSLVIGVLCDLLLPGAFPCFYTLVFPLAGLCASLLSQSILPAGFLCSLVSGTAALLLTDGFHCLLLLAAGKLHGSTAAYLTLRELCVTLPLAIPMTLLFRAVHHRTHLDD